MKFTEKLFTSKIFLYVVLVLTILTVLGYLAEKKMDSVVFLIAIGLIIKQFNNNMTVILLSSVFITSLFTFVKEKTLENMAGFRSRHKKTNKKSEENTTEEFMASQKKLEQYENIKDTYNDLISTIKAKTEKIKQMTKKIKV